MLEIEWKTCHDVCWLDAEEATVGNIWLLVGVIKGWTWGVYDLNRNRRIITSGDCNSREEAESMAEGWISRNMVVPAIALCDECYTRHKPGENPLCPL